MQEMADKNHRPAPQFLETILADPPQMGAEPSRIYRRPVHGEKHLSVSTISWYYTSMLRRTSFFQTLRFRLILLILLALLPAVMLTVYNADDNRRRKETEAQADVQRLAHMVALNEAHLLTRTRQILTAAAQHLQGRLNDQAGCNAFLAELLKQNRDYSNFGVIASNGSVFASAVPLAGTVSQSDKQFFRLAIEKHEFAVGDYQIGRLTLRPSINCGYPVLDVAGQVQMVIYAALNLDGLSPLTHEAKTFLSPFCTLSLTDNDGIILIRDPDSESWSGKRLPEPLVLKAVLSGTNCLIETPDTKGIPSLYVVSSLHSPLFTGDLFVVLGLPKHILFAEVNQMVIRNLLWVGGAALLVLIAGWIGSNLLVLGPVKVLVRAAERVADGDLSARAGFPSSVVEFKQLARSFDHMACSLEQRQAAQKRTEEALHQLSGRILCLQDDERRRIARELHDATAQNLAALAINLDLLRTITPGAEAKAKQLLADSLVLADQCANEVRTMSYLLHPPLLEEAGLADAVRDFADGFAERSGIRVDLHISDNLERLPREVELTLFRVLQESLANVRRHSGSPTASVNLIRDGMEVWLEVEDQGCGMSNPDASRGAEQSSARRGVGIAGMKERLSLLGGRLVVKSGPHGTSIKALLPIVE
jgi:signal transduction histidine kinase